MPNEILVSAHDKRFGIAYEGVCRDRQDIIVDLQHYPSVPIAYELAESIKPKPTQFANMAFPNPALPGKYYGVDVLDNMHLLGRGMRFRAARFCLYSTRLKEK